MYLVAVQCLRKCLKTMLLAIILLSVVSVSILTLSCEALRDGIVSIHSSGNVDYSLLSSISPSNPESQVSIEVPLYTGFGQDYLWHYSDQPATVWGSDTGYVASKLDYWSARGYSTSRLTFSFDDSKSCLPLDSRTSLYDQVKMDSVIAFFYRHGVRSILDHHDFYDKLYYYGSWTELDSWLAVAEHYKGDSRIAGFNLANEVRVVAWTGRVSALDGPVGDVNNHYQLTKAYVYLTMRIREVDPSRVIFFPTFCMYKDYSGTEMTVQLWYDFLKQAGQELNYDILHDDRVIFDLLHPYYFQNELSGGENWDFGLTPSEKVAWYDNKFFKPAVGLFGADRLWVGETYAHEEKTEDLQVEWLKGMIALCKDYGIGFQILCFLDSPETVRISELAMR